MLSGLDVLALQCYVEVAVGDARSVCLLDGMIEDSIVVMIHFF